jgi:hypothetical protein
MSSVVLRFTDIVVAGQKFAFGHLIPFVHVLPRIGPLQQDIRVRVSFRSHVFSKAVSAPQSARDFRDENGKARSLCPLRMAVSLGLPDVCRRMMDKNYLTWISADRNSVSNLAVVDGVVRNGSQTCVFYALYPSKVPDIDVELVVKSAYETLIRADRIKRRFKVLQLIKKCVWEQKPLP